MKIRIVVVSFLVVSMTVIGQSGKLKKADKFFEKLSYSFAIKYANPSVSFEY